MFATITDHPEFVVGATCLLLGVVGYFLKKVDNKIDLTATIVSTLKAEIPLQLATMRSDLKEDIVDAFNSICVERQGSCSRLQQAKLDTIMATNTAICAKLGRLDEERKEAWSLQRRWNDKIETTIYSDKGGVK
jgi:outer membrane murein-binding lipoprotein Lpp